MLLDVLVAGILLVAAGSKLRAPLDVQAAFTALRVPAMVNRRPVLTGFPWAEGALGILVLVTWGRLLLVVALFATALMATYLVLVLRASRGDEQVECACFGTFSAGTIGPATVARNAFLTVAALLVAVDGGLGGGVLPWVADAGRLGWAWIGVSALALAVLGSILYTPAADRWAGQTGSVAADGEGELMDYIRLPVPYVALESIGGERRYLREMVRTGPLVLIFVSFGCASCLKVLERLPQWQRDIPVEICPVVSTAMPLPPELPTGLLLDPAGEAFRALDMSGNPSAVLLGADGLLAGGPVLGSSAIRQFIEDIAGELADSS